MTTAVESPLLTLDEAAKILRCSVRGVQRLVTERKLPKTKIRGRTFFRSQDLVRLIDRCTR